jgi:hypothetical protein
VSLRAPALVSGAYDLLLGVGMLIAAPALAQLFGAPAPVPLVNAWLNGVFTLTLALLLPGREAYTGAEGHAANAARSLVSIR